MVFLIIIYVLILIGITVFFISKYLETPEIEDNVPIENYDLIKPKIKKYKKLNKSNKIIKKQNQKL